MPQIIMTQPTDAPAVTVSPQPQIKETTPDIGTEVPTTYTTISSPEVSETNDYNTMMDTEQTTKYMVETTTQGSSATMPDETDASIGYTTGDVLPVTTMMMMVTTVDETSTFPTMIPDDGSSNTDSNTEIITDKPDGDGGQGGDGSVEPLKDVTEGDVIIVIGNATRDVQSDGTTEESIPQTGVNGKVDMLNKDI